MSWRQRPFRRRTPAGSSPGLVVPDPRARPPQVQALAYDAQQVQEWTSPSSEELAAQRGRWLTFGNLAFPALLIGFALSRSFILSVLVMLGVGFCFVLQNALANTLLQIASPDELRGRVMSFYTMTFQVTMRLGGLQAGLVADWLGAPFSIGVGAVVSLLYGLFVALRFPAVREMK